MFDRTRVSIRFGCVGNYSLRATSAQLVSVTGYNSPFGLCRPSEARWAAKQPAIPADPRYVRRTRRERRAEYPSFLSGNRHSLIQAGFIDRQPDSAERIEPPVATTTIVKKVPDSLFNEFIVGLIRAAGEFLLDLLVQIGW